MLEPTTTPPAVAADPEAIAERDDEISGEFAPRAMIRPTMPPRRPTFRARTPTPRTRNSLAPSVAPNARRRDGQYADARQSGHRSDLITSGTPPANSPVLKRHFSAQLRARLSGGYYSTLWLNMSPTLDATFGALSHPVRRQMLNALREGPMRVTELAEPFTVSLAASSKHIGCLEHAGLVSRNVFGSRSPAGTRGPASWGGWAMDRSLPSVLGRPSRCARRPIFAGGHQDDRRAAAAGHDVRLERLLPAPVADVFAAWTDPALMAKWLSPTGYAEVETDLRVGGHFAVTMIGDDLRLEHTGEYLVIDPPRIGSRSPGSRRIRAGTPVRSTSVLTARGSETLLVVAHPDFQTRRGHHTRVAG